MEFTALFNVENIITSLAMTLIQFCWQAVIIALVLKTVLFLFNKQALKIRYYAALFALIGCVLVPIFTFISYFNSQEILLALGSMEEQLLAQPEQILFMGVDGNLFEDFWLFVLQFIDIRVLVLLWALGALSMVSKFTLDLRDTYRLTRLGTSSVSDELQLMVNQVSGHFGISRSVRVLKSTLVNVPVVIGWLSPTVLLPVAIIIGLERKQLELIIAHELAHVKRLDFLVNLIQGFVQVVFFYHPCIFWINKVLREEREYICDSMALSMYDNKPGARLDLAKALVNIEELKEGNLPLIAVAASDGHLKNRIGRIVFNDKNRMGSSKGVLVSLFTLVFSFTTIAVTSEFSNGTNSVTNESVAIQPEMVNSLVQQTTPILYEGVEPTDASELKIFTSVTEEIVDEKPKVETQSRAEIFEKASERVSLNADTKKRIYSEQEEIPLQISTKTNLQQEIKKQLIAGKSKKAIVTQLPEPKLQQSTASFSTFEQAAIKQPTATKVALVDALKKVQFKEPRAISTPYPVYPASAFNNKLSRKVKVDFIINEEGRVVDAEFGEGTSWVFVKEIRSKFKDWRYEPAVKNGVKTAYNSSIYFDFELPDEKPLVRYQVGSRIRRNIR